MPNPSEIRLCPKCHGLGQVNGHSERDSHGSFWVNDNCKLCGGIGCVSTRSQDATTDKV